ncbi:MAG TPA: SDR family oxidoreductase [Candidatus Moranbacteria bacterium]|nr:MAG: oxidoreductase [Candidatus Moranbacteria bacterium GW2011_GWC2_45_10]HAV11692.1 SDR family oxidoreductase [Candidatus Moranbacteria bacterium]
MKTALITGASRGIGKATAEKFLANGWKVIGTSISGKLPFENENLEAMQLDLSGPESIEKTIQGILESGARLDVLVNNAGVALDSWDAGVDLEKVRKTFEVNLFGLIDFTEKLLSAINGGGHIINLSSRYGSFSMPVQDDTSIGYMMSKASLNMYTRFLAFRLKNNNIKVSSIHPGWIKTDMGNSSATETEKPEKEPEQAAGDIYKLATAEVETGQFWFEGKKMEW